MLLEPEGKSGKGGDGFDVMKSGDARVALIVRPSCRLSLGEARADAELRLGDGRDFRPLESRRCSRS